jgi:hypothetical protein
MVSIGLADSSLQVAFMRTEDRLFPPDRNSYTAVYHTHGDMRVLCKYGRGSPRTSECVREAG